jgi:hypothetical protein
VGSTVGGKRAMSFKEGTKVEGWSAPRLAGQAAGLV